MNKKNYIFICLSVLIFGIIEASIFSIYENSHYKSALEAVSSVAPPGNYNDCESLEDRAYIHRESLHMYDSHFKATFKLNDNSYSSSNYPYKYELSEWAWVIFQTQVEEDGDVLSFLIYPTYILSKQRINSGEELIRCLSEAYSSYCKSNIKGKNVTTDENMKLWEDISNSIKDNSIYQYNKVNCDDFFGNSIDVDYFRVIIDGKCTNKISPKFKYDYIETKENITNASWVIFAAILFVTSILRIIDWTDKRRELKNSKLYKLKKKSNPANFMNPYQKDKVDKANEIYSLLMKVSPDDSKTLESLELRIENELNISRIDKNELQSLLEKCNPQNYMNPYNPEKVSLSNELYAILIKKDLTFNEFEIIKKKAQCL